VIKYIFPAILIVLDIGAAIVYGFCGDKIRVAYWLGAGLLTYCSIYMK